MKIELFSDNDETVSIGRNYRGLKVDKCRAFPLGFTASTGHLPSDIQIAIHEAYHNGIRQGINDMAETFREGTKTIDTGLEV